MKNIFQKYNFHLNLISPSPLANLIQIDPVLLEERIIQLFQSVFAISPPPNKAFSFICSVLVVIVSCHAYVNAKICVVLCKFLFIILKLSLISNDQRFPCMSL